MEWNGVDPMPDEYYNILMDSGSESEDEFPIEDEEMESDLEENRRVNDEVMPAPSLQLWDLPIVLATDDEEMAQQPISSLNNKEGEVEEEMAQQHNNMISAISPLNNEEDEVEEEMARQHMLSAISPLNSPVRERSPIRFRIETLLAGAGGSRGNSRRIGRGNIRGRETIRGRRRGRGGGTQNSQPWSRGDPLVEIYVSDESLPEDLRNNIEAFLSNRRRQRNVNSGPRERHDEYEDEAEFFDAEEFLWEPMDSATANKETFVPESTGPTQRFSNAYDAFRAYWDQNILTHIVTETNVHARSQTSGRFQRDWFDTNLDEILLMFAFWMMLGIIHMPSIKSCFSQMPLLRTEVFRFLFKESRYWNLNRAFHFARGSRNEHNPDDVLYPIGHVINHLNSKFKELYVLEQEICIDESLTLWKGPLGFKQYIKTKAARFGIKTQQLCESSTGYLWSFFVYIGKRTSNSPLQSSVSTVLRLIRPLLNLGHTLYMDNWFNSPLLARYLKRKRTDCVGTLRANRLHVPPIVQKAKINEGEFIARKSGDVRVIAQQDRKRIQFISTYHDLTQIQTESKPGRPSQYKLQLNVDYNRGMGGVDRLDQMLEPYLVERKQCIKWTRKLFKRLLNVTIQNARILVEKSTGTKIDSLVFRLMLVQSIINHHYENAHVERRNNVPKNSVTMARFTERHFVQRILITEEDKAKVQHKSNLGRKRCVFCLKNGLSNKKTVHECEQCQMPLCLEPCFKLFHTLR